jgi:hypothetical protein
MTQNKPTVAMPTAVNFIDNPLAPDVFADTAVGFTNFNGVVRIALASSRTHHASATGPVNQVVVGRLVMPILAAQNLAVGLFDFLKSHGIDPLTAQKPN